MTSFDSVFYADSESGFVWWLELILKFENGWIPLKIPQVPVNRIFLDAGKERKKKRCVTLWLVVWWVEWDKIFASITYVKKLDRFTKTTYAHCARRDLERHRERILQSRVGLTILLGSVFDAESKKNIARSSRKAQSKIWDIFRRGCVFSNKWHPSSFLYFSTWKRNLREVKSCFSWSAVHTLSNDAKTKAKEKFTRSLNCLHLTLSQ